jgi:GNAT superfamily N-acetyltransferase
MPVDIVDGRSLDDAVAQEIATVTRAATEAEAPQDEPRSAEHLRLQLKHGWDDRGVDHVLLGRVDGSLAAYASLELPAWDNRHMAFVELYITPDHRATSVGDEILAEVYTLMREHGRTLLVANAWKDSDLERFWIERGLVTASEAAERRLLPKRLDWQRLDTLLADALAASAEYDAFEVRQPVADDLVEGMARLQTAMNDAPLNDLALEDDVWSEERYRGYESALAHRAMTSYRLVAQHRASGALAGFTALAVERARPHLGFQEDTAVVREHRGHRLGLRLKIEMLRLLRDREPAIVQIDTWNALSNRHMIAVNDAIGCIVVGYGSELQRDLATGASTG